MQIRTKAPRKLDYPEYLHRPTAISVKTEQGDRRAQDDTLMRRTLCASTTDDGRGLNGRET